MNRYEMLSEKFARRHNIAGTTMTILNEPLVIQKMKRDDLDFILFDMEHGRFDTQDLVPMLTMCRMMEIPSIVRVQESVYHLIAKTIDMGADGIMLPRTETLDQVKTAVDAMRFYPIGKKGCGGVAQFRPGETLEQFQSGRFLIPQIESPLGIENLPEILRVYGDEIAGIIVGPYDMSIMVGTPLDIGSPPMLEAIKKVIAICEGAGKSSGVFCDNVEKARLYHSLGANIFWTGAEIGFYLTGYHQTMNGLGELT